MYVFGIDIPLMEALFVFFIFFIIGFIIIVFDLRKLKFLIKKEKEDITELEDDINVLEKFEKKKKIIPKEHFTRDNIPDKYYKELKEFLKKYMKKGIKVRQLKKLLRKKGWKKSMIKHALKDIKI